MQIYVKGQALEFLNEDGCDYVQGDAMSGISLGLHLNIRFYYTIF